MSKSKKNDKLTGLRSGAAPSEEAQDAAPTDRVWLVYAGTTGPEGHWQPTHEGPQTWQIGEDFVGLAPGLNIRTAEQWAGCEANKRVAELIADGKITTTDEHLTGHTSVSARTLLAKISTDPAAVAWMYDLEDQRPVTAGRRERRQPKIVELLARALKRIQKKAPVDFSALGELARKRPPLVSPQEQFRAAERAQTIV